MTRLAPVVGDPRGQELLETRQSTRSQHLGAQRVALQLLEVCLTRPQSVNWLITCLNRTTLTARYPLGPPPLVRACPRLCITPSFPSRASATAAVVLVVVSFSNLTDMAPQCDATAANGRWARIEDDAAVDEMFVGECGCRRAGRRRMAGEVNTSGPSFSADKTRKQVS